MEKVRKIFLGRIESTAHAAVILATLGIVSQLLGLLRDRLFAHYFGAGETLDLYYAAFRIPDLLFASLASLVSLSIVIPLFVSRRRLSEEAAKNFLDILFSWFVYGMAAVSIVLYIFAPAILEALFPLLVMRSGDELVFLSRILLLSPFFLGLSHLFASVTQSEKQFVLYACSPVLYNLGIIFGVLFLYPLWGSTGLALGVVLGAFLHMAIQIPVLSKKKLLPRFVLLPQLKEIREVLLLSIPRALALSSAELSEFALVSFAGLFAVGTVSVFNLSWNLQSAFLSLIGVSYSLAVFPRLVEEFQSGQNERFGNTLSQAFRTIIFLSVPLVAVSFLLRENIVEIILQTGNFSGTAITAALFAGFIISLPAQCFSLVALRAHYARGKTVIPFIINLVTFCTTIGFGWYSYTIDFALGLPLAFSISAYINAILHGFFVRTYFPHSGLFFAQTIGRSLVTTIPAYFTALVVGHFVSGNGILHAFLQTILVVISGGFVWFGITRIGAPNEYREIILPALGKTKSILQKIGLA